MFSVVLRSVYTQHITVVATLEEAHTLIAAYSRHFSFVEIYSNGLLIESGILAYTC